jgi:hypothetical protein
MTISEILKEMDALVDEIEIDDDHYWDDDTISPTERRRNAELEFGWNE